jgi:hypothetical protein
VITELERGNKTGELVQVCRQLRSIKAVLPCQLKPGTNPAGKKYTNLRNKVTIQGEIFRHP